MLEKLKEIIADQLNVDADSITAESRFKEDLEADSLDLFELVMALEEEYGVEIPSEDLEKILTVQDVIDYMKNKVWHGSQHMNWPVRYPMPADLASSEQVEHRLPGCVSRFRQQKKKPTSRLE